MRRVHHARLIAAAFLLQAGSAAAEPVVLDLHGALARAATGSPEAVAARGRVGEARALRVGAGVHFLDNPELEVEAGPRFGDRTSTDVAVQIGQTFPLAGRRDARRRLADAEVAHAEAAADATAVRSQLEVALAFLDALHAQRLVDATRGAEALAQRAAEVAERRRAAGQITDLEAGLAKAALGRARAAGGAAETALAEAMGRVAEAVGLADDESLVLEGDLRPSGPLTLGALASATGDRADVRALAAEARVADAEARLARADASPDLGLWIGYRKEEAADLVVGGLRITLPVWNRGQGPRAAARARASRIAAEHAATRRLASRQLRDAFAVYEHARDAVAGFEADVLPTLDDSERLLGKSVDAGTIAISDYLVARQELLDARRDYVDLLLALARARVTAQLLAGVSP